MCPKCFILQESELFKKLQSNSTKYPQNSDANHLDEKGGIFTDELSKNETKNSEEKIDTLIEQLVEAINEEELDFSDENEFPEEMSDKERSTDNSIDLNQQLNDEELQALFSNNDIDNTDIDYSKVGVNKETNYLSLQQPKTENPIVNKNEDSLDHNRVSTASHAARHVTVEIDPKDSSLNNLDLVNEGNDYTQDKESNGLSQSDGNLNFDNPAETLNGLSDFESYLRNSMLQNHEDSISMTAGKTSHAVALGKRENQDTDPIDYIQIREIRNLERKVETLLEEIGSIENFQHADLPISSNQGQTHEEDRSNPNINIQPKILLNVEKHIEPLKLDSPIENYSNENDTREMKATIGDLVPSVIEILNNFDDDEEEELKRQSAKTIEDFIRSKNELDIKKTAKVENTIDVDTEKSKDQEFISQAFAKNRLIPLRNDQTNTESVVDERNLKTDAVFKELLKEETKDLNNQKFAKIQETVSDDASGRDSNNLDSVKLENMERLNLYGKGSVYNIAKEIEHEEALDEVKNQMHDLFMFENNWPKANEMQKSETLNVPQEQDESEEDYDVFYPEEKKSINIPNIKSMYYFNKTNDIDNNNFFDIEYSAANGLRLSQAIDEAFGDTNSNNFEHLAGFSRNIKKNLFGDYNDGDNNEIFSSYVPKQVKFANAIDETSNKDVFETSLSKNNVTNDTTTNTSLGSDLDDLKNSEVENLSSVDDFLLNIFEPFDMASASDHLEAKKELRNNDTDGVSETQLSHEENGEVNVINDLDPFLSAFPNLRTFEELHRYYNDFTNNEDVQQEVARDNSEINNNHAVLEESNIDPYSREDHVMQRQNMKPTPVPDKNILTDSENNAPNENVETDFKPSVTDYKENNPHNEEGEDNNPLFRLLFFPPNVPNTEELYGVGAIENTKPAHFKTEQGKVTNDDSNSDTSYPFYGDAFNQPSRESNNFLNTPSRLQGNQMHNRFHEVKDTENKDSIDAFVDIFSNSQHILSPSFYRSHREHNKWWLWFWSYLSDFEFSRTPHHINYDSDFSASFDINPPHHSESENDNLPLIPNEKDEGESNKESSLARIEELVTRNISEEESNKTLRESTTASNFITTNQNQIKPKLSGSKFFANILSDMKGNPKHSPQKQFNAYSHTNVNRTSSHYYVYDFLLAASIGLGLLFCIALWLLLVNARRAKKLINRKKTSFKVPFEDCCDHITHKKQPLPEKGSKNAYFIAV